MKILFVVTDVGVSESYGPMYLSSIAKKQGHQTRFVRFSVKNINEIMKVWKPDIVGWSAFSGDFDKMAPLNDRLKKEFKFISIFGGAHPTYFPESLFKHTIDYGVLGEGEGAFEDLIHVLESGGVGDGIKNVVTPTNRTCVIRPLIADMDSLPIPDYEGYYEENKWTGEFPVKIFMPSRGCPFNCAYCFNHQYMKMYRGKGKIVRRYSVERAIEEILYVRKRYPLELVRFNDDCFVLKKDAWMEEFCDQYPRRVGLPFFCVMNPNLVTDEIMRLLKNAGCVSVFMSIECGNEAYRKEKMGRNVSDKKLLEAFQITHKYKINVLATNILALPGRTLEDDLETLKMNYRCKPACGVGAIFTPYPNLRLTEYAISQGAYSPPDSSTSGLPSTIFGRSVLNFTDEVKIKQKNLADVFTLLVSYPFLEKIVLPRLSNNLLIKPLAVASSILMGYHFQTRIYPHRLTFSRLIDNLKKAPKYFWQALKGD